MSCPVWISCNCFELNISLELAKNTVVALGVNVKTDDFAVIKYFCFKKK
jgi:hypothetical protein